MSDNKDQNHIFPEPDANAPKKIYRPVMPDESSNIIYSGLIKNTEHKPTIVNENISFKGVIKDISNTNLDALVKIKEEDEYEHRVIEDQSNAAVTTVEMIKPIEPDFKETKTKKVINFDPKVGFWEGKIGRFIKKFWWLLGIMVTLLALLGFFGVTTFLENNKQVPKISNIDFKIEGPDTAPRGTLKKWGVIIENKDKFNLKDLTLEINYDREFKLSDTFGEIKNVTQNDKLYKLDLLKVGEKKVLTIEGKLEAQVDIITKMSGKLRFYVADFDKTKQSVQEFTSNEKETKVERSVIRVDITSESRVPKESDQDIKVDFTNQSGKVINNIALKLTYPTVGTNFVYISSELFIPGKTKQSTPSVGDHTWNIQSLENGQTGTLIIKTKLKGQSGDKLQFKADLISTDDNQLLNRADKEIIVVDKALTIKPSINFGGDYIKADQEMNYKITIKNNYNTELTGVKVVASFVDNADLIDKEGFTYDVGSPLLDKNKKELVYSGSGLAALQRIGPKAEQVIEFRFKSRPGIAFTTPGIAQDNFYLIPKVSITGDNFEPQTEQGDIRRAQGGPEIKQSVEIIPNTGTKKMVKVTWEVKNKFTKLTGFKLRTRSPLGATAWSAQSITPPSGADKITFNPTNGEIVWAIAEIEPFKGYNGQELKISFTLSNESDSKINYSETPTYTVTDTLNAGFEYNQLNTPIVDGNAIPFN
jgi:hypothetical protein